MSFSKIKDPVARRLAKIALVGAFATLGTGAVLQSIIRGRIHSQPYFEESLKILHGKQDVVNFLGPPIGIGKVDIGDEYNYSAEKDAKLKVPLTGAKEEGNFYIWASRESISENWKVDRLEISIKSQPGKRILVHQGGKVCDS